MTKQELAALPKGTKLFLISRIVSRSGMRQVFDVFYLSTVENADEILAGRAVLDPMPRWIRIAGQEQREFNKRFGVHACGSVDEDRRIGGSYYVNGYGYSRSDALVEALSLWGSDNPKHFTCEVL